MADTTGYPQIPSTVWSGVWKILHDSPSRKLDSRVLAVELGVQETAARQYLKELGRLGLFNDDGTSTDLAKRWRQDGDDQEIILEILEQAYPSELREIAPPERLDRDKIVRWFLGQGLGSGSAKNKASAYIRIASGVGNVEGARPSIAPTRTSAASPRSSATSKPPRVKPPKGTSKELPTDGQGEGDINILHPEKKSRRPDLNVNIQIHISADSSSEQIDAIFLAMKRYFDDPEDTE